MLFPFIKWWKKKYKIQINIQIVMKKYFFFVSFYVLGQLLTEREGWIGQVEYAYILLGWLLLLLRGMRGWLAQVELLTYILVSLPRTGGWIVITSWLCNIYALGWLPRLWEWRFFKNWRTNLLLAKFILGEILYVLYGFILTLFVHLWRCHVLSECAKV
jgi:hypothetical protein